MELLCLADEDFDLEIFEEEMKKHLECPKIYTHDELCKMLLDD